MKLTHCSRSTNFLLDILWYFSLRVSFAKTSGTQVGDIVGVLLASKNIIETPNEWRETETAARKSSQTLKSEMLGMLNYVLNMRLHKAKESIKIACIGKNTILPSPHLKLDALNSALVAKFAGENDDWFQITTIKQGNSEGQYAINAMWG